MKSFNLKELMGILDHETSTHGLHPILQSNWADAQSVLDDIGGACQSLSTIGQEDLSFVKSAYFAYLKRDEQWAEENGYKPQAMYLTPRVDLYEVPGPIVMTVGSATTARVATVVVVFHDVDVAGYGDWATATGLVHRIHDDEEAANDFLKQVNLALRTQRTVMSQLDKTRSERGLGRVQISPAF